MSSLKIIATMSLNFAWFALIFAGICEVIWAYFLKQSKGFSEIWPTILFMITLTVSMFLLAISIKSIPLNIAYPIWTGIGAVGSVLLGIIFFGETLSLTTAIFLTMIIGGVVGLKFFS